jgi:hypothetical protein
MCSIDAFGLSPSYWNLCDVVYQVLFNVNDTDGEPQEHGDVTIEVISLICTHLYLTVSRLMKNELPGGCHT